MRLRRTGTFERVRSGWAVVATLLVAVLGAGTIAQAEGAARPPLPAGAHRLAAGQLPRQCTVKDGAINAYATNFGYYFSTAANTWISAPWCYPRWGNLEASASQITRDGGKVTVTAIPTEGSNSGEWAPKTKSITWQFPGKRVAGCGNADLRCTVIVSRTPGSMEWQWFEFHVSMPRTFFIDSPGEFCAGQHACPGNATQAWSFVGIAPGGTKPKKPDDEKSTISGRVVETDCSGTGCKVSGLPSVGITATSGKGTARSTTGNDGRYSLQVEKGGWKVTPSLGGRDFDPASRSVTVNGDASGVDFRTCAEVRKTQAVRGPARAATVCGGPDGLDWSVPDRVENQVKHWHANPILDRNSVYPSYWPVDLFLTKSGEKLGQCGDAVWQWTVTPPKGATVKKQPEDGCKTSMKVSDLGTYKVEVTGKVDGKKKTFKRNVVVKDWVIVGMGDSNGSGEGNAPFEVERCNRGDKSYQYLTAKYVEEQDPHTSVTFLFASCSGAIVANLDSKPYPGLRKATPFLDAQIDQALWLLTRGQSGVPKDPRPVDAAIISAGVNDIAFGPVMETCTIGGLLDPAIIEKQTPKLAGKTCVDWPVELVDDGKGWVTKFNGPFTHVKVTTKIKTKNGTYTTRLAASDVYKRWEKGKGLTLQRQVFGLIDRLPAKYAGLAQRLALPIKLDGGGLGMRDPSHVFITQYPNFTSGANGSLCDDSSDGAFPNWDRRVWSFINNAGNGLNEAVVKGANLHHWTPVLIPATAFRGHGYCAKSETWFTSIWKAVSIASTIFSPEFNNKEGAFHPNKLGHEQSARYTRAVVCMKLYKKSDCTGDPRP